MNIVDYIPKGKENAISRANLMLKTGFCDRDIRIKIPKARSQGVNIIFNPKGGYYIAESIEEKRKFVKSMDSRVMAINKSTAPMKKQIAEADGIKYTTVKQHIRRVGTGSIEGQIHI